jgi:glutathione S-transferase
VTTPSSAASARELVLVGRSTSHFTRVTRIFAAEAGLSFQFQVVPDLRVGARAQYAGNPALKVPILRTPAGEWFGTLNICRELARRSPRPLRVIWPEALEQPLLANAQELVLQAMSTEVTLLMGRFFGETDGPHAAKLMQGLTNSVEWLEQNVDELLARLPADRELSFLELTLYCLMRHLPFRKVLATEPYTRLNDFCRAYEARQSVQDTPYRVD